MPTRTVLCEHLTCHNNNHSKTSFGFYDISASTWTTSLTRLIHTGSALRLQTVVKEGVWNTITDGSHGLHRQVERLQCSNHFQTEVTCTSCQCKGNKHHVTWSTH
eukprot:3022630-Amphidinium_carterae.1